MAPGDGSDGLTGMLIIESKAYSVTSNATKSLSFMTLGQPTVKAITALEIAGIIGAGSKDQAWNSLSRYWLHPAGSGSDARVVEKGAFL
ncbi:hypothetical protein AJ78_03245 [Emergomyces pasteurianus Ep9510]|uniref:Uncharacterized protein n=1 Tax=Emergomyces pasteurianus Ep9510 TaxID=1447872 RepID=A0A1J9QN02_9EURO|nr:hypothetical protein AJ78_03245 [Emergomyces pasteurianus Ep9510]